MRAEYPLWVCKPHVYEFRDLWMRPERATAESGCTDIIQVGVKGIEINICTEHGVSYDSVSQ